MNFAPILRSQTELLSDIEKRMRDTTNERWSDTEIYDAINDSLQEWHGRVQVPRYYDIDWTSGTYEYTLPDYIDVTNMDVQSKKTVWGLNTDTGDAWEEIYEDIPSYYVVPSSTGGMTLCVESAVNTADGRIIWWGYNGPVPTSVPATNGSVTASATSVVLDSVVTNIGRAGYVKMNDEWASYAGFEDDGSNTTLTNVVRALNGSTAATHTAATDVEFCVAMVNERLQRQLFDQVAHRLHALFLTNAAPNEQEHHERLMGYYDGRAERFWRSWVPARPPKMRLSRRAIGEIGDEGRWDYRHYWDTSI